MLNLDGERITALVNADASGEGSDWRDMAPDEHEGHERWCSVRDGDECDSECVLCIGSVMTMQAFRDHETALVNPPIMLAEDESCDRCDRPLGDTSYKVRNPHGYNVFDILCEECVTPAERCSECGYWRCACPDD